MIFTTYWFAVFAALLFALYWSVPSARIRMVLLTAACVIFHAHFAGPAGVIPVLVLGAITYAAGRSERRDACTAGIVLCVLALVFYKYTHFLCIQLLGWISPALGAGALAAAQAVAPGVPPLAISFFTFEFVHYLYDVRKGGRGIRAPLDFTVFTLFFPSLVAGPIKRFQDFIPSLHAGLRSVTREDVIHGFARVVTGYVKKVLIADNLAAWSQFNVLHFHDLDVGRRWMVFAAIGFRLLLDFSGYSDIAIGLARMLGIRLPENFRWPYLATNLQEFWQRWHISLSTWIRDYVYIPLGGSRHGKGRRIFNGAVAFSLCGLWHGADWNFVVWGLYHAAGLAFLQVLGARAGGQHAPRSSVRIFASWATTLLFVWIGWLFFFYPVSKALKLLLMLFGHAGLP